MMEDDDKLVPSLSQIIKLKPREGEGLLERELLEIESEKIAREQAIHLSRKVSSQRLHPSIHMNISTRRRQNKDEWLLTYLDTITLLFALFALLLSISTITPNKLDTIVDGLSINKYGQGIIKGGKTIFEIPNAFPPTDEPVDDTTDNAENTALTELQNKLNEHGLSDDVEVKITNNLVDLQLKDSVLFSSGDADLLEGGKDILKKLTPLFQEGSYLISVEGNTDNIPISNDRYPSNWELSGSRASAVARGLIDLGVKEDRLQIVGHAHTSPISLNDTPEGRLKNRRVNLILHINADQANSFLK